jgi:putative transposase
MDTSFCTEALTDALNEAVPTIFNTDQGSQFTSSDFTNILKDHKIQISMDGKGRYLDNIFVERLWRSLKYEEVYLKAYEDIRQARVSIADYFRFYNFDRPHQALGYLTPWEVYQLKQINNEQQQYPLAQPVPHVVSMDIEITPSKELA